MSGLVFSPPGQ
uniref:Uncharacterized protein n=1 Tax=Anguilla anguilla TaxID=7936 RepID=A0A0E9VMS4_ANGAN